MEEIQVGPLDEEDPLEEGMAAHSGLLAWRIPGQRSLAGRSASGRKEFNRTEPLTLALLFPIPCFE